MAQNNPAEIFLALEIDAQRAIVYRAVPDSYSQIDGILQGVLRIVLRENEFQFGSCTKRRVKSVDTDLKQQIKPKVLELLRTLVAKGDIQKDELAHRKTPEPKRRPS